MLIKIIYMYNTETCARCTIYTLDVFRIQNTDCVCVCVCSGGSRAVRRHGDEMDHGANVRSVCVYMPVFGKPVRSAGTAHRAQ